MALQQALATGTLGSTPVANLLVYVLDRRLTGTLVIEDPEQRKSAIVFRHGAPIRGKVAEPVSVLSQVLVTMEAIDPAIASTSFESARAQGRLHGDVLVADRLIEPSTL